MVEKLLQRLVAETQIRQPAPVVASEPAGLESLLRSLLSGQLAPVQQPRQGSFRREVSLEWNAVVCFSCGKAGHNATQLSHFRRDISFYAAGVEGREDAGWLHHDFTPGGGGTTSSEKRRLIRGGGGGVRRPDQ